MKPLSRPRRPFWGPLKAILDFVGVEALQVVGVKKNTETKNTKISKYITKKEVISDFRFGGFYDLFALPRRGKANKKRLGSKNLFSQS